MVYKKEKKGLERMIKKPDTPGKKASASSTSPRKLSCVTLSNKRLNVQNLVSYEKQQVPTDAIMFITARGIKICVSANQKWVQTAIKKIDERRAAKRK